MRFDVRDVRVVIDVPGVLVVLVVTVAAVVGLTVADPDETLRTEDFADF